MYGINSLNAMNSGWNLKNNNGVNFKGAGKQVLKKIPYNNMDCKTTEEAFANFIKRCDLFNRISKEGKEIIAAPSYSTLAQSPSARLIGSFKAPNNAEYKVMFKPEKGEYVERVVNYNQYGPVYARMSYEDVANGSDVMHASEIMGKYEFN